MRRAAGKKFDPQLDKIPDGMTFEEFAAAASIPRRLSPALRALWHDRHGEWEQAHDIVMDAADEASAWVHAYLHRKEGDLPNAGYWYRRAGQPVVSGPLEAEWESIAKALLPLSP